MGDHGGGRMRLLARPAATPELALRDIKVRRQQQTLEGHAHDTRNYRDARDRLHFGARPMRLGSGAVLRWRRPSS